MLYTIHYINTNMHSCLDMRPHTYILEHWFAPSFVKITEVEPLLRLYNKNFENEFREVKKVRKAIPWCSKQTRHNPQCVIPFASVNGACHTVNKTRTSVLTGKRVTPTLVHYHTSRLHTGRGYLTSWVTKDSLCLANPNFTYKRCRWRLNVV